MKIKFFIISIISILSLSCLDDINTVKKENLFVFLENFKKSINENNIKWIERNSNIENINSIKNIIIDNEDSIKNLIIDKDGEYSITINYTVGDNIKPDTGYYIIRNTKFSPTYYYIKLIDKSNKWKIESINKLPL